MRRWQAIPVAALVATLVGGALFGVGRPTAHAAAATDWQMYLDCDTSTSGIQDACIYTTGTTSVDVAVVLENVSGDDTAKVSSITFDVLGTSQATFAPKAGVDSNLDGNPDLNQAGLSGSWSCSSVPPVPDQDPSPSTTDSALVCYTVSGGPTVAVGGTLVLGTVHYTSIDGIGNFSLSNVSVADEPGAELIGCNVPDDPDPTRSTIGNCFDASVQVGGSETATATATPTDTPVATATHPPGTATSPAYVTVTPTGSPSAAATPTPAAPAPTEPVSGGTGGTTGGTTPGGGAGAGSSGPIRLPDTGTQGAAAGSDWMSIAIIALIALAAGSAAGGAYFGLAHVRGTRGGGR